MVGDDDDDSGCCGCCETVRDTVSVVGDGRQ